MLRAMWDDYEEVLTIRRPSGQVFRVRSSAILAGGHMVFGVETVGDEIHVLTGPKTNRQPTRRVRFTDAGRYKGSTRA